MISHSPQVAQTLLPATKGRSRDSEASVFHDFVKNAVREIRAALARGGSGALAVFGAAEISLLRRCLDLCFDFNLYFTYYYFFTLALFPFKHCIQLFDRIPLEDKYFARILRES
jgi:hypothetical protein